MSKVIALAVLMIALNHSPISALPTGTCDECGEKLERLPTLKKCAEECKWEKNKDCEQKCIAKPSGKCPKECDNLPNKGKPSEK
jgi:hypothetical protein